MKGAGADIPVFVISLSDETERRAATAEHLNARGFSFEFFDAVDGRQMDVLQHPDYDGKRRRAAHGRDLKPGELGCLLSHRQLYQKMIDEDIACAFVLEDDVRLHEDMKAVLDSLLAQNVDFDVVRLFGSPKVARGKHRKIMPLYDAFSLVRLRTAPGGTHAQIISRSGAEKLLKNLQHFTFPVDTVHGRCWETGVNCYSIQPGLAVQDLSFDSAIGEARHDKTIALRGFDRAFFKLTRAGFKLNEAIGKAWTYWSNAPKDLAMRRKFG